MEAIDTEKIKDIYRCVVKGDLKIKIKDDKLILMSDSFFWVLERNNWVCYGYSPAQVNFNAAT